MPDAVHSSARHRRAAFTFIELMLASMITALASVAGSTLIFAISNAFQDSSDLRAQKTNGQYALSRVAGAVREARAVGSVTPTAVVLWTDDSNPATLDELNLYEVALIRYDGATKQILYETLESADPLAMAIPLLATDFTNVPSIVTAFAASPDLKSVVWADDIESFSLTGYPANTDTRIVEVRFTTGMGANVVAFQTTGSLKAPGDYLFVAQAQASPLPGSQRVRRKHFSRWDGFGDLTGG